MNTLLPFPRLVFTLLLGMVLLLAVAHAEPRATATLSQRRVAVGDSAQLVVEVTDVQQLNQPEGLQVDGLTVEYRGYQQNTQIINGQVTRSVTLTFSVEPQRAGEFAIPAIEIRTDAGVLKTEPLKLTVEGANPGGKPPGDGNNEAMVFAEIEVAKKDVYVGEAVPVDVRLYFDRRIRGQPQEMPLLEGEGFTKVPRFPRPREEDARKGGRNFRVFNFRTTIAPIRAGKVTVGPIDLKVLVSVPRARPRRQGSPFDLFDDDFFAQAFGATEEKKVIAPAVELDVKPLPTAGRPADFSGAVGKFKFFADGTPNRVKVGDPITMRMQITGQGNFDRVNAPTLVDPAGWHTYPANGEFKANDDLAYAGTKSFEVAVVPEVVNTAMPQFQFSYFDPEQGKYVTLQSGQAPLTVEGAPPTPAADPVAAASSFPPENSAPKPPAAPAVPTDILGLKYEEGSGAASFEPVYRSRLFWLAQGAPALGLLALLVVRFSRKEEGELRRAALRQERAALWRSLRGEPSHAEFYEAAARLIQIETALATGAPDRGIDPATVRSLLPVEQETAAAIDEIFAARGELLYAGTARTDGRIAGTDQQRVLGTLEAFEKRHAPR